MGMRRFRRKLWETKQKVDPVGSEGDLANSFQRSEFQETTDVENTVNAAQGAVTSYMNQQDREAYLAKLRDEYERRRKANKTQTILTSGTGASGTPETSRPTLLGGR